MDEEQIEESTLGDVLSKIETEIKDTGESVVKAIKESSSSISNSIIELLGEIKKSNILHKKMLNIDSSNKPINSENLKKINKNLLVIHNSVKEAIKFAKALATSTGKTLLIIENPSLADMVRLLTNAEEGSYIFIDYIKLSETLKNHLVHCVKTNSIPVIAMNKTFNYNLKPFNYIIYTDMIDLVDYELVEVLETIN